MKIIFEDENQILLCFDKGEDVVSGLIKFAAEQKIPAAGFTGLGACNKLELAYYNLGEKKYHKKVFVGEFEITNLTGNIAWMDDKPIVHMHGNFSGHDFKVFGGHVFSLMVSATCEIHLQKIPQPLSRQKDEDTGLNLLKS